LITLWILVQFTPDRAMRGSGLSRAVSASDAMLLAAAVLACLASLWWVARAAGPAAAGTGPSAGLTAVQAWQTGAVPASVRREDEQAAGTHHVAGVAARSEGAPGDPGRQ
jgi:hypothetical protein